MFLERLDVNGYRAAAHSQLTCEFPGRFSLLLGANGAGKTTINEAIMHAHRHRFPRLPQVDAATLGPAPRAVSVEYSYEVNPIEEGMLGQYLRHRSYPAPKWSRPIERSLGKVRAGNIIKQSDGDDNIRLIHRQRCEILSMNYHAKTRRYCLSCCEPNNQESRVLAD